MKYFITLNFLILCACATAWSKNLHHVHYQLDHQHDHHWDQQNDHHLDHHDHPGIDQEVALENEARDRCQFHCTEVDLPICATNGECLHQFRGKCELSAHNCRHADKQFIQLQEIWKCEKSWAPLCALDQLDRM